MHNWLEDIEARLGKVTGPWRFINDKRIPCANHIENYNGQVICKGASDVNPWDITPEDGEFIAHSVSDITMLIDEYKKVIKKYAI